VHDRPVTFINGLYAESQSLNLLSSLRVLLISKPMNCPFVCLPCRIYIMQYTWELCAWLSSRASLVLSF
jgi:hypothetical protein